MTRSDETEGGEEGKGKGEEGGEGGEEILADGRAHGPIKGSTRGPRGPENWTIGRTELIPLRLLLLLKYL